MSDTGMSDPKQVINDLIDRIGKGQISPDEAWNRIRDFKEQYLVRLKTLSPEKDPEQSWHSFIGKRFQKVVYSILKSYLSKLKTESKAFESFHILTESEISRNDVVSRKLAVKYGRYLLLPDTDMVIVRIDTEDQWKTNVVAIVSCKTSLRERIAQACYWKLKLLSSDATRNIKVFLATTDNDGDFAVRKERDRLDGLSRNRVISEYELDGVYILRDDFNVNWESGKVKRYERFFYDMRRILTC